MSATTLSPPPLTPLGIVPEKAVLAHQIRRTVPAQYWGTSFASASASDGALASPVSDPAPLSLLAGSGLSRPHLILAAQALKLPGRPSLPGLPSLCQDQGGLVLDRVVAHGSGDSWWAVLRRASPDWEAAGAAGRPAAAADPGSYSLCATSRMQLSRNTVLRSRLDWCPPADLSAAACSSSSWLHRRRRRGQRDRASDATSDTATPSAPAQSPGSAPAWAAPPASLSCQVQSRVGRWAEVRADLGVGQRTSNVGGGAAADGDWALKRHSSSNEGATAGSAAAVTPLLVGLQAGSLAVSRGPLVWRCGVLQVTAPPTVPLEGGATALPASAAAASPAAAAVPRLASAVYVQGTVALQGERVLWQAPKRQPRRRTRTEVPGPEGSAAAAGGVAAVAPVLGAPAPPLPAVAVRPAAGNSAVRQGVGGASHTPARSTADENDDEDDDVDVGVRPGSAGKPPLLHPGRAAAVAGGSGVAGGGGSGTAGGGAGGGAPFGIQLPSAPAVQETLMDATQSCSRLRDDVTAATQWVKAGGLVERLDAAAAAAAAATPGAAAASKRQAAAAKPTPEAAQVPWSVFVGEPSVKVAGVAGITTRAPVVVVTHGSAATPDAGAQSLDPVRQTWVQDLGLSRVLRGRRRGGADADAGGAAATEAAAAAPGGAIIPSARCVLRPFASAAASVQAGRFSGWVLDFTRLSAQLDCGLFRPGAPRGRGNGEAARQRHPAFALSDTGAWHALSLSLSQQLIGPLRFAADWRYELASGRPLALPPAPPSATVPPLDAAATPLEAARAAAGAAAAAGSWMSGAAAAVADHTTGMRPRLLDAVYALDLAVPGTRGVARVVAWYAPQRREGMVEVRLF